MKVRRALPGDGAGIGQVHVESWRTTYRGLVPQAYLDALSAEQRGAWWEKVIREADGDAKNLWVAVDDTAQVGGFANGGKTHLEVHGFTGELYAIYLLESVQRQGLGRALMKRVAADLWAEGHRTMLLGVLKENPACRFYERMGGVPIKEETIERGGKELVEVFYGWHDLGALLEPSEG
jgi:GNAT superfamily N-acetyltransferase